MSIEDPKQNNKVVSPEIKKSFEEVVPIGVPMTIGEAINLIAKFHGTSKEKVLDAFSRLKNPAPGVAKISFERIADGVLSLSELDQEGKTTGWGSSNLVNAVTGHPVAHWA